MSYLYSHKKNVRCWQDTNLYISYCEIATNFGKFYGEAHCHPDDSDMNSQHTGEQIAYHRALIKMLKYERDCILKPQIIALKHVVSILNMKKTDSNSYAVKTVKRQLKNLKWELEIIQDNIAYERKGLREYIAEKEKIYQTIRAKKDKKL